MHQFNVYLNLLLNYDGNKIRYKIKISHKQKHCLMLRKFVDETLFCFKQQ